MGMTAEQEAARKASNAILKKMRTTIQKQYTAATDAVADEIAKLKTKNVNGKYSLTIASKEKLKKDLAEESVKLRKSLNVSIKAGTHAGVTANADRYNKYTAGFMTAYTDLDKEVLKDTFNKINADLVEIQFLKTYEDGLRYSKRIWKSTKLFERDIRNVVAEGIIRNRDIIDISNDLKVYVRKGKEGLVKRYANIDTSPKRPGESQEDYEQRVKTFKTRVSGNIEYNSLRIARTQIQGAIQDSNIAASSYVPSVKSFDWTLSPAHKVYSVCEDIVSGNPYTYETWYFQTPPHPNCMSYVKYTEIPNKQFVADLKAWTKNPTASDTLYLNEWKGNYYDPMLRGEKDNNYFTRLLRLTNTNPTANASLKRRAA